MKKISEPYFYDLLSLKLSGDATTEQLAILQEQLLINPQWQFLNDQVMQHAIGESNQDARTRQAYAAQFIKMQLSGRFEADPNNQVVTDETVTNNKFYVRRRLRSLAFAISIAASLIAGILCIHYLLNKSNKTSAAGAMSEIATKKGSKSHIKLPDGTNVWLNADSRLTYGEKFIGKTREVTLAGEAYFDVFHDTSHPFIIHTANASIRVIGTAFNVRNYPQDNTWETTLMRGKIEVSMNDRPGEKIILKPLEKLIISKNTISPVKNVSNSLAPIEPVNKVTLTAVNYFREDSLVAETSWISDKLVFINEPLQKIAEELERQFAITVIFKTEAVKKYRYTADFDKSPLEKILQIIRMSKKIDYSITDSTVVIEK